MPAEKRYPGQSIGKHLRNLLLTAQQQIAKGDVLSASYTLGAAVEYLESLDWRRIEPDPTRRVEHGLKANRKQRPRTRTTTTAGRENERD